MTMDSNKIRFDFEIILNDNMSDTLKEMVIATIKHDVEKVLAIHKELVNELNYSAIGVDKTD